jgi:hypothetical protein
MKHRQQLDIDMRPFDCSLSRVSQMYLLVYIQYVHSFRCNKHRQEHGLSSFDIRMLSYYLY